MPAFPWYNERDMRNNAKKFTILTFSFAVLFIIAADYTTLSLLRAQTLEFTAEQKANLIRAHAANILSPADFSSSNTAETKNRLAIFLEGLRSSNITRIDIADASGRILFSSDTALTNKNFPKNVRIQKILQGDITARFINGPSVRHVFGSDSSSTIELYAPLSLVGEQGIVPGIVRAYVNLGG